MVSRAHSMYFFKHIAVTRLIAWRWLAIGLISATLSDPALAQPSVVRVAVAANFTLAMQQITTAFEAASGHRLLLSFGSTGGFYAQIAQGAPFDVLLAADQATPAKAIGEGLAVGGTSFTYATGRLVLYSAKAGVVTGPDTLKSSQFSKLAIANPAIAPYGAAAVEVMTALGIADVLRPKLAQGAHIGQALQFIETHNAELGFVALAQIAHRQNGSRWIVPANLHTPIRQDAVLLKHGAKIEGAQALLAYLATPAAKQIIRNHGYETE